MNTRKYKTNPYELQKQGKYIISCSDDTKYYFKVFSVSFVLNGMSAAEAAEIAEVLRTTVSGRVKLLMNRVLKR